MMMGVFSCCSESIGRSHGEILGKGGMEASELVGVDSEKGFGLKRVRAVDKLGCIS